MQKVYFLSGLGADERAFRYLDLSFCQPVHLPWLIPKPDEGIEAYASRMLLEIAEPDPVIVGLSFGGIMAIEMAKQRNFRQIILISSAKTYREIPFYIRLLRYLPIYRWIKPATIKRLNLFAYQLMGIEKRRDKVMFMQMFQQADDYYVSWAIDKIVHWRNTIIPPHTTHIHGTHDILTPHIFVRADHSIRGGKHLVPMIQPEVISALLRQVINEH